MLTNELILVVLFLIVTVFLTKPFGRYISRVFESKKVILSPVINPIKKLIYKLCWINEAEQMNWKTACERCKVNLELEK